ncbi:MAG: hypothetical protein ACJ8GK_09865 [Luteimonas sp.]
MRSIALWLCVLAIATLAYWPGLGGPFVFDDTQNLLPLNDWLHGSKTWMAIVLGNTSGLLGRPVSMASLVLNIAALGPSTWSLKLGNVLIHLVTGCVVFRLFVLLQREGALVGDRGAFQRWVPLLASAAWLLHPLLVSTVLYVVQRMAMLSALFVLLALVAYLHGRIALRSRGRSWPWFLLAIVGTALATLSKENGALAVPLCALLELTVFAPAPGARRNPASKAMLFVGLVLPAIAMCLLVIVQPPWLLDGYAQLPFSLAQRIQTQPRVLWDYVGSLLLPYGPKLGLYHDDYAVSGGLLHPATTSIAILAWIAVLACAWRLRRSAPGILLGTGWFLIAHAMESTIFPLLMYFEHRNYLPAVGAIWAFASALVLLGAKIAPRMHHPARVFGMAAGGVVLMLAVATAARAGIWSSKSTLVAQSLAYHPDSRWLRMDAAQWEMDKHPPDFAAARVHTTHLQQSADAADRRLGSIARLLVDCTQGVELRPVDIDGAFDSAGGPIGADTLIAFESLSGMSQRGACKGLRPVETARRFDAMLDGSRANNRSYVFQRLRFKAAQLYATAGDLPAALAQNELAVATDHVEAPVYAYAAQLDLALGRPRQATEMLDRAEAVLPRGDVEGHRTLRDLRRALPNLAPRP